MRRALLLAALSLTACGAETADMGNVEPPSVAPPSDLALPVTAPMAVRERLMHDVEVQDEAARERERQLDELIRQNR